MMMGGGYGSYYGSGDYEDGYRSTSIMSGPGHYGSGSSGDYDDDYVDDDDDDDDDESPDVAPAA
jgi:hypothetical protein